MTPKNKIHSSEGKEQIHREIWKNIFTQEIYDNNNIDNTVQHFLHNNIHRTIPYNTYDPNRLQEYNYLTRKITPEGINNVKKMIKTCPVSSGIYKTIIKTPPVESGSPS